jgi:hypothetical protein
MRPFIALHVAAGPSGLLLGICEFGKPHAQFPLVLHGGSGETEMERTTTDCGRWSQLDNHDIAPLSLSVFSGLLDVLMK